jgi:hypothetical protein
VEKKTKDRDSQGEMPERAGDRDGSESTYNSSNECHVLLATPDVKRK